MRTALILGVALLAQTAQAQPRTEPVYGLWITKSVTIPSTGWADRSDYFGGRLHLRIPLALDGRLAILGRADVLSMPGSNPFKDFGAVRGLEAYGGLEAILVSREQFDLGAAAIYGSTFPFADGVATVTETEEELYAGGLVLHNLKTGAWAALMVGQYDAAGPGTRVIVSFHLPIKAGFSFLADYVSGEGGWVRPGVAYGVSW